MVGAIGVEGCVQVYGVHMRWVRDFVPDLNIPSDAVRLFAGGTVGKPYAQIVFVQHIALSIVRCELVHVQLQQGGCAPLPRDREFKIAVSQLPAGLPLGSHHGDSFRVCISVKDGMDAVVWVDREPIESTIAHCCIPHERRPGVGAEEGIHLRPMSKILSHDFQAVGCRQRWQHRAPGTTRQKKGSTKEYEKGRFYDRKNSFIVSMTYCCSSPPSEG